MREVSAEADAVTRTYEVAAGVDAPEKLKMLSGMTAVA
ncbi:efflux RND transporter periplasmic adaptor subunit, partial [Oceanidesulfovibrio marinus]